MDLSSAFLDSAEHTSDASDESELADEPAPLRGGLFGRHTVHAMTASSAASDADEQNMRKAYGQPPQRRKMARAGAECVPD